ncbi:MAG: hypothetical protein C5B52_05855, partial [Bacteroidetes bacterium]
MSGKSNQDPRIISSQNANFYDEIADHYDLLMSNQDRNAKTRVKVAAKFTQIVQSGSIMDFGGGTGLDLPWLSKQNYQIYFCEPSLGMRQKAIDLNQNKIRNPNINFLMGSNIDFANWPGNSPFPHSLDGILTNFAVLNNIPNLPLLFQSFSLVLKPGGNLIACILDNRIWSILRHYPFQFLKSLIAGKTISTVIHYKEYEQMVYIHTMKQIRKASELY